MAHLDLEKLIVGRLDLMNKGLRLTSETPFFQMNPSELED